MSEPEATLRHRTIAIPESRQQDVLADLLVRRGATVLRCPLIAIKDSPDVDAVEQWMAAMIAGKFDDFIILTGEGLRRLEGFAERLAYQQDWHRCVKSFAAQNRFANCVNFDSTLTCRGLLQRPMALLNLYGIPIWRGGTSPYSSMAVTPTKS